MSCCVDTGGEKPDSQGHGSSAAAVLSLDLLLHSSPLSFGKTQMTFPTVHKAVPEQCDTAGGGFEHVSQFAHQTA